MPQKKSEERHVLSKTSFIKSIQCLKQLYLYKNRYFLRDKLSEEQKAIFKRGHAIGNLAWSLFPNGIDAAPKSPMQYQKALDLTHSLIERNQPVIYEASFRHHQCLSILDMLVHTDEGWMAYEVKSSTQISDTFLQDAAFQYFVMAGAGCCPKKFVLIYVNPEYQLDESFSVTDYFKLEDITEKVVALQPFISTQIETAKTTIQLPKSPIISIGMHCDQPYHCDFFGFCRKYLPQPNIFSITDLSLEEQYRLYDQRKIALKEINPSDLGVEAAMIQLDCHQNEREFVMDSEIGRLDSSSTQIGYFVWDKPAIPIIQGYKPYQPVLMSYFWRNVDQKTEGFSELVFHKWVDYSLFLEQVKSAIAGQTVVAFDQDGLPEELGSEIANVISIKTWLRLKKYYHPQICGDYSFEHLTQLFSDKKSEHQKSVHHELLKAEIVAAYREDKSLSVVTKEGIADRLSHLENIFNYILHKIKE